MPQRIETGMKQISREEAAWWGDDFELPQELLDQIELLAVQPLSVPRGEKFSGEINLEEKAGTIVQDTILEPGS